jgi:ATP-dependent exoDNAse (exonuclease V) alpha subunit
MLAVDESNLINCVYDSMSPGNAIPRPEFFRDRAILALRNDDVRSLNSSILKQHPGLERVYHCADSYMIEPDSEQHNRDVPLEFLHTLNAFSLPISELRLKEGCPVIILRNIDTKRGLCNGTRATVLQMTPRVLHLRLIGGDHDGETVLIPRITLSPSTAGLDFAIKLKRRQFPVQLAYAMTIHKSQGQSLNRIGIDLQNPIFAHSQLYVAFSRATSPHRIKVLLSPDR